MSMSQEHPKIKHIEEIITHLLMKVTNSKGEVKVPFAKLIQIFSSDAYLSFTNLRGPANTAITIPMMDKIDAGRRSHYLTLQFSIGDAPGPDEILVALGGATTGRPHHRIGDRYQDLAEMGNDVDNPAGV